MASRLLRYSALVLILLILQILLDSVRSLDRKYKFISFAISEAEERRAERLYASETGTMYRFSDSTHDHIAAAKTFDRMKLHAFSIRAFQAAVEFQDTSEAWNDLGVSFLRASKPTEARQAFERAIWLDKNNDGAHDNYYALLESIHKANNTGTKNRAIYVHSRVDSSKYNTGLEQPIETHSVSSTKAFFDFISSDKFRKKYFEKSPVLLRSPQNVLEWTHSLERVLSDWYKIGNGGYVPPFRNVNFLKGSLIKRNGEKGLPKSWGLRSGLLKSLRMGYSLQLLHAEHWVRSLARFVLSIMSSTKVVSSTNIYITPPGREVATPPHVDFTGSWMVQLNGRKKWKLWVKDKVLLPVYKKHIIGRDEDDNLNEEKLGKPSFEVVLEPGDILWVPRGCIHATSTGKEVWMDDIDIQNISESELLLKTSMHLTTHMARLHDFGGMEQLLLTALNGNENPLFESRWSETVNKMMDEDISYRRGLNFYEKNWKKNVRMKMHEVVDRMLDNSDYLETLQIHSTMSIMRRSKNLKGYLKFKDEGEVVETKRMPADMLPENMLLDMGHRIYVNESVGINMYNVDPFGPSVDAKWSTFNAPEAPEVCKGKKWLKTMLPDEEKNDKHQRLYLNYIGAEVFPKLYGPNSPDGLRDSARLQFTCVYTSSKGGCKSVMGMNGQTRLRTGVILLQYKRLKYLQSILNDLIRQDTKNSNGFDLYIVNNNVKQSQRCRLEYEVQKFLKTRAHKGSRKDHDMPILSIWTHHSPVNVGPMLSFVAANSLANYYNNFIFLDDDVKSPSNMVKNMLADANLHPKDMFSTWALIFLDLSNYWNRDGSKASREEVPYCGTAQALVPAEMFRGESFLGSFLSMFPPRYRAISDVWLNAYVTDVFGGRLRRASLEEHASLDVGLKDTKKDVALSTRGGMRSLKSEFLQFIATQPYGSALQEYFQSKVFN